MDYTKFRTLDEAENHFLEVLLDKFSLSRGPRGILMTVTFDRKTPAIVLRQEKDLVRSQINGFEQKAPRYQRSLDDFLLKGQGGDFSHHDPDFPFRYASGGTLPIIRIRGEDYYCLFYREIFPVGWNIANGGTDSFDELLNPRNAIERELREELLIFDLENQKRYVFPDDYGKPLDRPEFAVAQRFWEKRFNDLKLSLFEETPLVPEWLAGPDSLKVIFEGSSYQYYGFFLNINALDFGIEIDKIARLHLDGDPTLCDGEIIQGQLVNRPVGLFAVENFNKQFQEGTREFFPDHFFYNAWPYSSAHLKQIIEQEALPELDQFRTEAQKRDWREARHPYDLCPVTRRILERYLDLRPSGHLSRQKPAPFVFISHATEDTQLAEWVYHALKKAGLPVFFSKRSLEPAAVWDEELFAALESAQCLIAVASNPQHLWREWVREEYLSFFSRIKSGRKPHGKILPFICCFNPDDLPDPLSRRQVIQFNLESPDEGVKQLVGYCLKLLSR